jgi:hypothetical protein
MKTCRRCGSGEGVRRGLCARCRAGTDGTEATPTEADVEPPHDRPWVARSAFTRRVRRSPRS